MTQSQVPVLETFSTKNIDAYVHNKVKGNILTLYPPPVGLSLVGIFGWVLEDGYLSTLPVIGYMLIGVGALSYVADLVFRSEQYRSEYIRQYNEKMRLQSETMAQYLEREFDGTKLDRCGEQVRKLRAFYATFKQVLDDKFHSGGLTHDKYIGVGGELYEGALRKLQHILTKHRASSVIDSVYLKEQLDEISAETGKAAELDRQTLSQRLNEKEETETAIRQLVAEVEQALSAISALFTKVSSVGDPSKEGAFDHFRQEAALLAKNAGLYVNEKQL